MNRWQKSFNCLTIVALFLMVMPVMAQESQQVLDASLPEEPPVIYEERSEEPVAPGVTITPFTRFDTEGWVEGVIMSVDLSEETVTTNLLMPEKVAASAPLSELMEGSGAIAGVNGDFFDINNTQAPHGATVQSGELLKSSNRQRNSINAMVTEDKLGQISQLLLQGNVSAGEDDYALSGINAPPLGVDEMVLFTPQWGEASRAYLMAEADLYAEALLRDGKVVEILTGEVYEEPLTGNETVLSGNGSAAVFLQSLQVGADVEIQFETNPQAAELLFAVGGTIQLVKDGEINTTENADNGERHPRTAVGFSQDGKRMILAAVDGRSDDSRGMTMLELARLMKAEGAWTALNLDGGGSTTAMARPLGENALSLMNRPSGGAERSVANGIGVWSEAESGLLQGFRIATHSDRIFTGLTREFRAHAYDTAYAPFEMDEDKIKWKAIAGKLGVFEGNVFKAKKPGKGEVRAQYRSVKAELPIHVLGEPVSLTTEPNLFGLEADGSGIFLVTGKDKEGFSTFIEPRDVQLTYDQDVIAIQANADGSFTLTPLVESGETFVTAHVGELETQLGVTIGLETELIDDFEDQTNPWTFYKSPAGIGGSLEYVDAPDREGQVMQLSYDFMTEASSRSVHAFAPGEAIPLPGDVEKIGVSVYGSEANGHRLRAKITDANGDSYLFTLATRVDWTGWKYVEVDIPSEVKHPVSLNQIFFVETDRTKLDSGYILLDDVTAKAPQSLDLPKPELPEDPLILKYGELPESSWKFAVISDLQLDAENPNSQEVENAERILQTINQEDIEFVLFNGDVINHDTEEQYAFAKALIDENLDLPYYVLPGDHEVKETDSLDNFRETFGEDHRAFDHEGTRFILMNTAFGGVRVSNPQQWFMIQQTLELAQTDDSIHNVVLLAHHPLKEPLGAYGMTDQKEADLLESLLTDFREESGKPAIVISANAQMVNLDRRDGIPYLITGPSGKEAHPAPDDGGFYNYAVFGVNTGVKPDEQNPGSASDKLEIRDKHEKQWIQVDIRPVLEDVWMAKSEYSVGNTEKVDWTGVQADDRHFPLKYPATVQYEASDNLVIKGTQQTGRKKEAVAEFDPEVQTIRFFREGSVELTVKSGDYAKTFTLSGKN